MDMDKLATVLLQVSTDDAKAMFAGMDSNILSTAWKELVRDYAADLENRIELNGEFLWSYCIETAIYVAGLDIDKTDIRPNCLCSEVYYSGEYTEEQKDKFESLTGFELQIADE